ncbi:MAG: hypothetical protein IPN17_30615 [Deltaproteobacteria bacterium]|jgi:hypothetical protein|nr:hypothetical protein [Deltaproteobacteria bacterium]MBP6829218.1 hypothetical protein [Deltaproteobacteria bacterium]
MTPATVVVSPVAPGRWLASLPGVVDLPLSTEGADRVPRVRDVDFALWLGFERPRKFRELVRRMEKQEKLGGLEWRPTVGRQPVGPFGGGSKEFAVDEAWLTKEEALLAATQAGTPKAWAITRHMVRVFLAVDAAATPRVTVDAARQLRTANDDLRVTNVRLAAENTTLRERTADIDRAFTTGCISGLQLRVSILGRIKVLARLKTGHSGGPVFNSACTALHRDVKRLARVDVAWPQLPLGKLGDVTAAIDLIEHQMRRDTRARTRSRQLTLVPKPRAGSTG